MYVHAFLVHDITQMTLKIVFWLLLTAEYFKYEIVHSTLTMI